METCAKREIVYSRLCADLPVLIVFLIVTLYWSKYVFCEWMVRLLVFAGLPHRLEWTDLHTALQAQRRPPQGQPLHGRD